MMPSWLPNSIASSATMARTPTRRATRMLLGRCWSGDVTCSSATVSPSPRWERDGLPDVSLSRRGRPDSVGRNATRREETTAVRLTGTGHASLRIDTAAVSILCDPWVNPAYFASWFPFPDNSELDWETLGDT